MKQKTVLEAYSASQAALRHLADIARAPDSDTSWSFLEKLCVDCGFDYCGMGIIAPSDEGVCVDLRNASPFFQGVFDVYHEKAFHLEDPVARVIANGDHFINAEDVLNTPPAKLKDGAKKVKSHLLENGITAHAGYRVDMPGRPFASFLGFGSTSGLSGGDFRSLVKENDSILLLAASAYTSVALRERSASDGVRLLTEREAAVLTLLAKGLSPQEIAEQENRSLATIRHQIASARERLSARSPTHAVALALELGLIRI